VVDCLFSNSAGYAVECQNYSKKLLSGKNWHRTESWPPYIIKWIDGQPQITANDASDLRQWANSTLIHIARCRFENSMHAVDVGGDTAVIRDCRIATNPQMEGPALKLTGKVHFYGVKGLAKPDENKNQCWIQAGETGEGGHINIAVRDCDFDTIAKQRCEPGKYFTLPILASIKTPKRMTQFPYKMLLMQPQNKRIVCSFFRRVFLL
jgi:hypothetical protein